MDKFSLQVPDKSSIELLWEDKHPLTSIKYYPAQLKEQYGKTINGWINRIYYGNNKKVMGHLLKHFKEK